MEDIRVLAVLAVLFGWQGGLVQAVPTTDGSVVVLHRWHGSDAEVPLLSSLLSLVEG